MLRCNTLTQLWLFHAAFLVFGMAAGGFAEKPARLPAPQ